MPTIPQAPDFGARPSLRTGRVDRPDPGRLATSEALANAAESFANLAINKQAKDDATEYALAKSEFLKDEARLRRELETGGDYENFDENYQRGLNETRDRLMPNIRTAEDQALFGAETTLTQERGRTAMGEIARTMELDVRSADLGAMLTRAHSDVLEAPPDLRNEIIQNVLERIHQDNIDGVLTDVQAETSRQAWVSGVAEAALDNMEAPRRIEALKNSLAVGNNPQDFFDEKKGSAAGSGTLADFLPRDVKITMLREAEVEAEIDLNRGVARETAESAMAANPDDIAAQRREIKAALPGSDNAEALEIALRYAEENHSAARRSGNEELVDLERQYTSFLTDGGSIDNIPAEVKRRFTSSQWSALEGHAQGLIKGEQYALATRITTPGGIDKDNELWATESVPSQELWSEMSNAQRAETPLETASWTQAFEEQHWRALLAERDILRRDPTPNVGDTNEQIFNRTTYGSPDGRNQLWPATGRNAGENERYYRALGNYTRAVAAEQAANQGVLPTQEKRQEILNNMLADEAWVERPYMTDPRMSRLEMTPDQLAASYAIEFDTFRYKRITHPDGTSENFEEYFRGIADSGGYQTSEIKMSRLYEEILRARAETPPRELSPFEVDSLLRGYGSGVE